MESITLNDIAPWIRRTLSGDNRKAVLRANEPGRSVSFSDILVFLSERFGEPDSPSGEFDWFSALGIRSSLAAVWDFDYYQLSLQSESEDAPVILARHPS